MKLQYYTVELTSRPVDSDIVTTIEDIPAVCQGVAMGHALMMMAVPTGWYVSAIKLSNEIRLTKANQP